MVVVFANELQVGDIGTIEHADPRMPVGTPDFVANPHSMVQPVLVARPVRRLAGGDVLAGYMKRETSFGLVGSAMS